MGIKVKLERDIFKAEENCDLNLTVLSSFDMDTGDKIEIQFPNSWLVVSGPSFTREIQCNEPQERHFIGVKAGSGENCIFDIRITKRHLPYPESKAKHGRLITAMITSGCLKADTPVYISYKNTTAPYIAGIEPIWIRVKGREPDEIPEITTVGKEHDFLRIIAPSTARPDKQFYVRIISLDKFDNCSTTVFHNKELSILDGKVLEKNLDFKGSIRVPVKISRCGVYRFKMDNTVSNAVKVDNTGHSLYWGDIHIHSELSHDGQGNNPYAYAKDVSGLDFAGLADHCFALGNKGYKRCADLNEKHNKNGEFVTLLGDERNYRVFSGHHNIYFKDMNSFWKYAALPGTEYYDSRKALEEKLPDIDKDKVMIIPHHTGIAFTSNRSYTEGDMGNSVDMNGIDDKGIRPAVEIYSIHGQSELYSPQHILSYEFNRMHNYERRSNASIPGNFYAQDYWIQGKKIGVIASSDDHAGQGGRRHGGITAVYGRELTRENIFDSIRKRHCYATTGERILLDFTIDKCRMGGTCKVKKGNRILIKLKVWGTDIILRAELLRYRFGLDKSFITIMSESPRPEGMDYSIKVEQEIKEDCIFYARIVQEPLEWPSMAWTSPIWLEIEK